MTIDLYINEANDYAQDIGAPVLHPHVSVIHYDEVGEIRHTMNRFNCYGIFLQQEFPEGLTYGIGTYHDGDGSLIALSPGQIGGKLDDGTRHQYHGWVLAFDSEFIQGTAIKQKLDSYQFFSYHSNEALILTPEEKDILSQLMSNLRGELATQSESFGHDDIIRNYILLILDYCNRFYVRQYKEIIPAALHADVQECHGADTTPIQRLSAQEINTSFRVVLSVIRLCRMTVFRRTFAAEFKTRQK